VQMRKLRGVLEEIMMADRCEEEYGNGYDAPADFTRWAASILSAAHAPGPWWVWGVGVCVCVRACLVCGLSGLWSCGWGYSESDFDAAMRQYDLRNMIIIIGTLDWLRFTYVFENRPA
jgi:hypothetical protein